MITASLEGIPPNLTKPTARGPVERTQATMAKESLLPGWAQASLKLGLLYMHRYIYIHLYVFVRVYVHISTYECVCIYTYI